MESNEIMETGMCILQVTNFPKARKKELTNYVGNLGLTKAAYVKKLVLDDLAKQPEYMKQKRA